MKRLLLAVPFFALGCGVVLDFGKEEGPSSADGGEPPLSNADVDAMTPRWTWYSPRPTGNDLRGVWGTSDDDVWMVGDYGTVVHVDGDHARVEREGGESEKLYEVWGSSNTDVWIAGASTGGSALLHWDGATWSSAYAGADQPIRSLWGSASDDVWALLAGDTRQLLHFDGHTWDRSHFSRSCNLLSSLFCPPAPEVRELWGTSKNDVWAVGDEGAIYHFDGADWTRATKSAPGVADPFAPERAYVGVWGSGPNDVWAVGTDSTGTHPSLRVVSFSHWDGATWRVAQRETIHHQDEEDYGRCVDYRPPPEQAGRRMWGRSASDVVALLGGSYVWRWNGTRWARPKDWAKGWGCNAPYAFWGSSSRGLMAVGLAGRFEELRSETWTAFGSNVRAELESVSVAPDGTAWAVSRGVDPAYGGAGRVLRSTADGWVDAPSPSLDSLLPGSVFSPTIHALASNDVWVAGWADVPNTSDDVGFVLRYGEAGPSAPQLFPSTLIGGLWVHDANDAWAVATVNTEGAVVLHWDGDTWSRVPWSDRRGGPERDQLYVVTGTRSDDVWFSGRGVVIHYDGVSLETVYRSELALGGSIWANSPTDVWVGGRPMVHFDGSKWTVVKGTDYNVHSIWGSNKSDVWFAGSAAGQGGAVMHWDGATLSSVLRVSPSLSGIAGSRASDLWVVGQSGATLRYALPPTGTR